jgi:hypothetical protein
METGSSLTCHGISPMADNKDCELLLHCSVRDERTDSLLRSVAIGLCDIACCENWSAANTLLEGYPGSRSRSPGADV